MDVRIPCVCPGDEIRHPDGDTVTLKDKLGWEEARACRNAMALTASDGDEDAVARRLVAVTKQFVLSGISDWTLVNGKAIPVSSQAISKYLFSQPAAADIVADAADELYSEAVLLPLIAGASRFSPPTLTAVPTSAPTTSTPTPRKRSRRSSTTTSPTGDTATTTSSLDGGSSSSRSSA